MERGGRDGPSHTASPGLLLFLRLVALQEFTIDSGVLLAFPGSLEKRLLADYQRWAKKTTAARDARVRFIHFFKAHQAHGVEVRYE